MALFARRDVSHICDMYFGVPGSGKTTYAVRLARLYQRRGIPVYTNFPCSIAYRLSIDDLGVKDFSKSILILDEAGIDFNNRDWKSFPKKVLEFVKLHRHYGTGLIFMSQGYDDCDKKIRSLCTRFFNLKKLGPFTFCRLITRRVDIDKETKQILDFFEKVSLFNHGLSLIYRPVYYKYFNSWSAPQLPKADRVPWSD